MADVTLVTSKEITSWAGRRDAQGLLPVLVRRLVHATLKRVVRIGFPAYESVQVGGWDGILTVEEGNPFVPTGSSAWELTTIKNVRKKADQDYQKRCENPRGIDPPQSTFAFVSARTWKDKETWAEARRREGVWADVRAFDANDLESWLELAPAVHVWLSTMIGKRPEAVTDLATYWADWSEVTRPATPPALVLAGRKDVTDRIQAWIRSPAEPMALQAESRAEAIAIFAASLQMLPPDERIQHLARAVLVHTTAAWHALVASSTPLILIPTVEIPEVVPVALRGGHGVLLPLGQSDSASDETAVAPRLSRTEAATALVEAGVPERQARELAGTARRSLMSFRRKLAVSKEAQQPAWARPAEAPALVPIMLAGTWDDTRAGDRKALASLGNVLYEDLTRVVVRWANEADPPLRRVGQAWLVVSREDAWSLLARYLTRQDLERFEAVVLEVLGTPEPQFDLPEEKRWMAGVIAPTPPHSGFLRLGLMQTLAIMGARGDKLVVSGGATASDYADRIVRSLLQRANSDWRVWASLSRKLSLLAEAAPDVFLSALNDGLQGSDPVVMKLFTDKQGDPLFSSSPHTGLLWALETLAWSPDHLGETTLALGMLARLDPGGKLGNRPQGSLHDILALLHQQTVVPLDGRLAVLDALRRREPDVAWRVLRDILPGNRGHYSFTSTPDWREWGTEPLPRIGRDELLKGVRGVIERMLDDVGSSGTRWADLISLLPNLTSEMYERVVNQLAVLDIDTIAVPDRLLVWHALRKLIAHHRTFPDARWALPIDRVDQLEQVYRRVEPVDTVARHAWLFEQAPALPEGRPRHDWQANFAAIAAARETAVRAMLVPASLERVADVIASVGQPGEFGATLGQTELMVAEEDALLEQYLAAPDTKGALFARGFLIGRMRKLGRDWGESKLSGVGRHWLATNRGEFLSCMPTDARTWDLAEAAGPETDQAYWKRMYQVGVADADTERAVRKLIQHGRPYTAVELLAMNRGADGPLPPELIAAALECCLQTQPGDDPSTMPFSYHVTDLMNKLTSSELDRYRVAKLEWAFLPLLSHIEHTPTVLHGELARNPEFFAEIVARTYAVKGSAQGGEQPADAKVHAQHGYELLESWRTLPGLNPDGTIDADVFNAWIRRARDAMAATGHTEVGDQLIGALLSGSPAGPDALWPHPAVRYIIEETQSPELERGVEIGLYNGRGVVVRDPIAGGAPEHQLAAHYSNFATALKTHSPRTAAMLRRIASSYARDARREDTETELEQDLG